MIIKARAIELSGSSYDIGAVLGRTAAFIPPLKQLHTTSLQGFDRAEADKAAALFAQWCPGLNEELQGFADALQVPPACLYYYGMTYLQPNCSQIALLPGMTQSGKPLLARNYEFSHEAEDFTLVKTSVTGKYAHLGTSVLFFGREEGLNDCGLAVTMSSCGFPVGPMPYMRKPKVTGLHYWAVIRTLLENCRDVEDALVFMAEMPIAFNLNLILADKGGSLALVETLDGARAVRKIAPDAPERYLCATNHPVLPELIALEPRAMRHSLRRYEWIRERLDNTSDISSDDLKAMLMAKYPDGLCCHFYNDYFGTTKSLVLDPACGIIDICWGGRQENGWLKYSLHAPLIPSEQEIELSFERIDPEIGDYVPLRV